MLRGQHRQCLQGLRPPQERLPHGVRGQRLGAGGEDPRVGNQGQGALPGLLRAKSL